MTKPAHTKKPARLKRKPNRPAQEEQAPSRGSKKRHARKPKSPDLEVEAQAEQVLTAAEHALLARKHKALKLQHMLAACYLHSSMDRGLQNTMRADICNAYISRLLDQVDVKDPIAQMVVEQIVLAHHNVGRLHSQSASAETLEQAEAYGKGGCSFAR